MAAFARFHGRSEHWVRRVFAGKEPVPDHFRKDLSVFLEMDKRELFPELAERQPA
jgi:hypothetical protein